MDNLMDLDIKKKDAFITIRKKKLKLYSNKFKQLLHNRFMKKTLYMNPKDLKTFLLS